MQEKKMQQFRSDYKDIMDLYGDDPQFVSLMNILRSTESSIAMNRIEVQKLIDTSWVEAIELGLTHLDNILRKPGRTIEDIEEIVPIALSRKITVESVKHLAQHTDLIQSVDEVTGKITPSKILNVHKEETLFTYENKFINTLIERLRIFINLRYEKLAEVSMNGEIMKMSFNTTVDDLHGGKTTIEIKIENEHDTETRGANTYSVWQRVERLKSFIEGYKESELCKTLGSSYIRPPVMRTNAILKNVDLKACLTLWQYIESYDKVGYEINIEDSAVSPKQDYLNDFYELIGLHMLLFRASESPDQEILETKPMEPIEPKILRQFESLDGRFDFSIDGRGGVVIGGDGSEEGEGIGSKGSDSGGGSGGKGKGKGGKGSSGQAGSVNEADRKTRALKNFKEITEQIKEAIKIEKAYQVSVREKALAEKRAAEEAERRRQEEARIEAARKAELERIAAEKAEKERQIKEMLELERKKHEQEERERLAMLEKKRKEEEAEKARLEEERKQRIRAENRARERLRLAKERHHVREVFGAAYGVKVEELDVSQYAEPVFEAETTDMTDIVRQSKLNQQQREKERAETEYARRLDIDRMYFENKPFYIIRREYTYNPIWLLVRLVQYIMVFVFGIIPEKTDRPDFKQHRKDLAAKKEQKAAEKAIEEEMERYYKKYAKDLKYSIPRAIDDRKFRRKRLERLKKNPVKYVSKYTPEQQKEIEQQARSLYKEYRVSLVERTRRKAVQINETVGPRVQKVVDKIKEIDPKKVRRVSNAAVSVLLLATITASVYVISCVLMGNVVNIFGYSVLKVETGSMEPALHVDDYIIIRRCDPSTLMPGDIVSYYSNHKDIEGMLVTHRIESILPDRTFIVRGDANPVSDELPVRADRILGKFVRKSIFYNWLGSFSNPNKLFLLLVMIPMTLVAIYELRTMLILGKKAFAESEEDEEEKMRKRYEQRVRRAIDKEKKRLARMNYVPEGYEQEYSDEYFDNTFVDEVYQDSETDFSYLDQFDDFNSPDNSTYDQPYYQDEYSDEAYETDSFEDSTQQYGLEAEQEQSDQTDIDFEQIQNEQDSATEQHNIFNDNNTLQSENEADENEPEPPLTKEEKKKQLDKEFGNTETGYWWENIEDTYQLDNEKQDSGNKDNKNKDSDSKKPDD